jgi:hypothetical protein
MLRKMTYALIVVAGAILALMTIHPMATPIAGATITLPVAAITTAPIATLPACEYEDGSGQSLCVWDADTMGNGMGTDAIGGECAMGSVGIDSESISALCVKLWSIDSDSVQECTDIEFEASQDDAMRKALIAKGWNVSECFKAML